MTRETRPKRNIRFINRTGETIPARGCFASNGIETDSENRILLIAKKPESGDSPLYRVSHGEIADDATGSAIQPDLEWVQVTAGATISAGDSCGPSDDFLTSETGSQFTAVSDIQEHATLGRVVLVTENGSGSGERVYFSVTDVICADDSYADKYDETTLICQWEAHPSTPAGLIDYGDLEVVEHWGRILDNVTKAELTALVGDPGVAVWGSATRTKDRVDQGTWVGTDLYWHLDALHIQPNCEEA